MKLVDVIGRPDHVPLVWSNGMGVNSVAVACLMVEWGLSPHLNLMADTGGEWPETLQYIGVLDTFLRKHGLPPTTLVKKRSKYESLEHNCLATDTLPSKAYGHSSCSEKYKIEPQRHYCQHWEPAKACWAAGDRVIKAIGYDFGERGQQRYAISMKATEKKPDPKYSYFYPLREAKLDRDACKAVIRNAGLPVPRKSACTFCPAAKVGEIRELWTTHPELIDRAVRMELNAVQGKHGLKSTKGLGRTFSWLKKMAEISPRFAETYAEEIEVYDSFAGRPS